MVPSSKQRPVDGAQLVAPLVPVQHRLSLAIATDSLSFLSAVLFSLSITFTHSQSMAWLCRAIWFLTALECYVASDSLLPDRVDRTCHGM
ncbi:hypothetical protein DPMN_032341 [Dreissena polymorpha]|uniref:Uncharacterized protein n=1 Tax=Dreissena polymorpha TaxID=45954 RepID=A0A9D4M1N4_DREPO|nr:hypothetical protein DPMN_032341 [Dreissena polymorpha]